MKKVFLKRVFHRDKSRIAIIFQFDESLIKIVKSIAGISYSGSKSFWYTVDTEDNLRMILHTLRGHAEIDISGLLSKNTIDTTGSFPDDLKTFNR
jgi:hypothetical protein